MQGEHISVERMVDKYEQMARENNNIIITGVKDDR